MILISFILLIASIVIIPACTTLLTSGGKSNENSKDIEEYDDKAINVFNHQTEELMHMKLDEYLVGVVAGEMPASFELEALKAQAVAARTYAYRRIIQPDQRVKKINDKADVITSPDICQAWTGDDGLRRNWGTEYAEKREKIERAIIETKGQIIVYDNNPIDPLYHSTCGGYKTEAAGEVWSNSYPYLVSVDCTNHKDKHYQDTKEINISELDKALEINFKAKPEIKILTKTGTGRIKTLQIADKEFKATDLRVKLGLKSTWFTWKIGSETVSFTTRGFGHGVGLCQYGANDLASKGKKYDEILKRYYKGVELVSIFD
ncbi:stage II sporulation protein D [Desulfonispora thiosulfatigenes]|nr:stage II sporulation protein D [Desulfonispora thiosulfatigenes]